MSRQLEQRPLARVIKHKPVTLPPHATVCEACTHMHKLRIGAIMVVDDAERLVGIFTGRDAVRLLAEGRSPAQTHLREVMTHEPSSMGPDNPAIHALRLMEDGGFRHVPVVENGRVVGIVSHGDFRGHEFDRLDEESGYWERL